MLKNITLSADEILIERARQRARAENTTLNDEFRCWLQQYVDAPRSAEDFLQLMGHFEYAVSGKSFSRDEMNER